MRAFEVTGAAVSTLGDVLGSETIDASDAQAARLDEVQFDLGEGPCWDALRHSAPVLEPDLRTRASSSWPAFAAAIGDDRIGALFAFPLQVGPLKIGAVDMYSLIPAVLDPTQSKRASEMADLVARRVLQDALSRSSDEYTDDVGNPYSRRIVHQATGVVLAQLDISADDARLVIQGHAFSNDRSMMDVSRDILDGRIDFSVRQGRIEESE
ncbi:GAF and ANTAR domain-containing protein [Leifsonia sp. NPDC058292]|uniref:GAF and ANTAR domain-containing protein n=1 Tax=Leifsonia sp. NPDC058292 TaxID=3346428 RepID=UPI0036D8AE4D